MRVAVIGAGTMGNGIAQVFAQQGHAVRLIDVSAEALNKGLETIRGSLARLVKKETIKADEADKAVARIKVGSALEDAADTELVVEAASENPSLKFALFDQLDKVTAATTILASNTSSISITEIASHTSRADKIIGMHFMNPVPVMALVEVIRGIATSDETAHAVRDLASRMGKTPIFCNDAPGHFGYR